jgi:hypothetical protein
MVRIVKKAKINSLAKKVSSVLGSVPKKASAMPATKVVQWLLFILLSLLTTAIISYRVGKMPTNIKVSQIAPYDIKADHDYEIVDEEATAKFKAEALQNVKMTYTFDSYLGNGISERVKAAFDEIHRLFKEYSVTATVKEGKDFTYKDLSAEQRSDLRKTWDGMVGVEIGDKDWKFLITNEFSDEILQKMSEAINSIMSNPIISDRETVLEEKEKGIAVRILHPAGSEEKSLEEDWDGVKIESTLNAEEMKKEVIGGKFLPENIRIDQYEDRVIVHMAASLLQSNMVFDAQETEVRRQNILHDIKNVVINIQAGESIIRGGSRYEPWHIKVLDGIRAEKLARSLPLEMVGSFFLIFTIYLVVYIFGRRYIRRFAPTKIDLVFMGALMLVMLLVLRIALFLTSAIYGISTTDIPSTALNYAIPMAAGAMLVRFIINSETAALFAIVLAAFAGIVVQGNVYFTAYILMGSLVAAVAISHADKRSAILQAGIVTGLINAVIVLSVHLINAASVVEPLSLNNILWYEASAFISGIGCSVFVLVMAPLSESLFGYTTDIKLLELANLNHPLLRELIIRAPGTYHHSHLVGILAETAAEAVGANPLLARVGAYYHDIGKIKKPQYFTENMPEELSIHDSLTPHMSSLIIGAHIKDGMELAKMYKLPEVITDMIPQHHGTKKISFFYQKAKDSIDPNLQKVEDKDFRYPGPKPRTREAAILMLADGSEAAVRSIKDKTPTRIQQVVEGIIDKSFTEGQLNECELTLKDLNEIAKSFTRILSSIYHQRVEYPKEALKRDESEISVFEEDEVDENSSDDEAS